MNIHHDVTKSQLFKIKLLNRTIETKEFLKQLMIVVFYERLALLTWIECIHY
jgi:hypothetical protein